MLAVVKTPRTEFELKGFNIPRKVLSFLRKEYGTKFHIENDWDEDEESIDVMDWKPYQDFIKTVTPGDYLHARRTNLDMTQKKLGEMIGKGTAYVCDIEKGRRSISKNVAKNLSEIFGVTTDRFIQ